MKHTEEDTLVAVCITEMASVDATSVISLFPTSTQPTPSQGGVEQTGDQDWDVFSMFFPNLKVVK